MDSQPFAIPEHRKSEENTHEHAKRGSPPTEDDVFSKDNDFMTANTRGESTQDDAAADDRSEHQDLQRPSTPRDQTDAEPGSPQKGPGDAKETWPSQQSRGNRDAESSPKASPRATDGRQEVQSPTRSRGYTPASSVSTTPTGFDGVDRLLHDIPPVPPLPGGPLPPVPRRTKHTSTSRSNGKPPTPLMSPSVPKRTPPVPLRTRSPPPLAPSFAPPPPPPPIPPNIAEIMSPPRREVVSPTSPRPAIPTSPTRAKTTRGTFATSPTLRPVSRVSTASPVESVDREGTLNLANHDPFTELQQGQSFVQNLIQKFEVNKAQPGEMMLMLRKIQRSLPDVGRLVDDHRALQSQLADQKLANKEAQSKYEQALMQKDFHIEKLEYENMSLREALSHERADFEESMNMLRTEVAEVEASKASLDSYYRELRQQDEDKARQRLESRERELLAEIDSLRHAWETANQAVEESKRAMQAEYDSKFGYKQAELETTQSHHTQTIERLEKALREKEEALNSGHQDVLTAREQIAAKHSELHSKHMELVSKQAELESKHNEMTRKHGELGEMTQRYHQAVIDLQNHQAREDGWDQERARLNVDVQERESDVARMTEVIHGLQASVASRDKILESTKEDISKLEKELEDTRDGLTKQVTVLKGKLRSIGEALELNQKGDDYMLHRFSELASMISKFSEMTTANPPLYELPPEVLAELPSSIPFPAFLGDTDASHKLRGAYVQHMVYKILTRRIFEPFLLTIRGKQDEAGMLLATLASDMRKKSVRREALWRQLTVKTAYSTAGASQQHKAILRHVRDEVLRKVVPFVNPDPEKMTMEGVKDMATQLVGAAIETWRYARTERESIIAIMPPVEEVTDNGDWRDFDDVFNQATTRQLSQHREVLLRVAPRIYREPAHEDFFQDFSPERAKALSKECTYLPGTNLYADSLCLVARYAELPGSKGDFRMLRTAEKLAPSPLKPSRSVKEPNGNGRPQLLEWHS